jgi:hypothetical protein
MVIAYITKSDKKTVNLLISNFDAIKLVLRLVKASLRKMAENFKFADCRFSLTSAHHPILEQPFQNGNLLLC